VFWRAFLELKKSNNGVEPQCKSVWETVYEEWAQIQKRADLFFVPDYDKLEIIEEMSSKDSPNPVVRWFIASENCGGEYRLKSLPSRLSKFKKNPPF